LDSSLVLHFSLVSDSRAVWSLSKLLFWLLQCLEVSFRSSVRKSWQSPVCAPNDIFSGARAARRVFVYDRKFIKVLEDQFTVLVFARRSLPSSSLGLLTYSCPVFIRYLEVLWLGLKSGRGLTYQPHLHQGLLWFRPRASLYAGDVQSLGSTSCGRLALLIWNKLGLPFASDLILNLVDFLVFGDVCVFSHVLLNL